ncbi:hypothetical protein MBANPS3_010400 [Mucor bainieri]
MKLKKKPQRVQIIIKKADAMNITKQPTVNKRVTRSRTARRFSPLNVKKGEDDYKYALTTLGATLDESDASNVISVRVKTEKIKQEDVVKASLSRPTSLYLLNQLVNLHRTNYFWSQLLLQKLRHYLQNPENDAQASTISSQQALQNQTHQCRARH